MSDWKRLEEKRRHDRRGRLWRYAQPKDGEQDQIMAYDVLLERVDKPSPEHELAAAVMGEALIDLQRGPGAAQTSRESRGWRKVYEQTRHWVESESVSPYSFSYLCSLFDLDEGATRSAMLDIVPTGLGKSNLPALRASPHGLRRSIGLNPASPRKQPKRMMA